MKRIRVIASVSALFITSGCATYVWGHKWKLEGGDFWQVTKEERSRADSQQGDLIVTRCNGQELYLGTNQIKSGAAVAPLFIPVSISENENASKDQTLQIFLKYPHVKTLCADFKNEVISLSYTDTQLTDYDVDPGRGFRVVSTEEADHYCSILMDASVAKSNDIVLLLNKEAFGCELPPITISRAEYSCVKEARWGGTDCGVN